MRSWARHAEVGPNVHRRKGFRRDSAHVVYLAFTAITILYNKEKKLAAGTISNFPAFIGLLSHASYRVESQVKRR